MTARRRGPQERNSSSGSCQRQESVAAGQLELYFGDLKLTTAERLAEFDRHNPAVYQLLARLARRWIVETGGKRLGIGALVERVRWESSLTTTDPDFEINNTFRQY
jgi:hypothetical protein